jgi:hypothetical protein
LALLAADATDGFELLLDVVDAEVDLAAVGLELGFAGTAGTDAAAELAHGFASTGETGELIFELGQLDLELTLAGAGVAGEDVEDELGAVDDAAGELVLEIAKLGRGEVMIEEDEVGVGGCDDALDLFELTAAYEGRGIGLGTLLGKGCCNVGSGAAGELFELGEGCLEVEVGVVWLGCLLWGDRVVEVCVEIDSTCGDGGCLAGESRC